MTCRLCNRGGIWAVEAPSNLPLKGEAYSSLLAAHSSKLKHVFMFLCLK